MIVEEEKETQYEITETFLIVGRIVHLVHPEHYIKLMEVMNEAMRNSGKVKFSLTLPCMINVGIKCLEVMDTGRVIEVFESIKVLIEDLASVDPIRAAKECLQIALTLRNVKEAISLAQGFIHAAMKLYGNEFELIPMIVGTLKELPEELMTRETALNYLAEIAEQLPALQNSKQGEAYIILSHAYLKYEPDKVNELLKKAVNCIKDNPTLSIKVLNAYLYYIKLERSNIVLLFNYCR
jgi:hypothetical protein